jgi:hypothetical protein
MSIIPGASAAPDLSSLPNRMHARPHNLWPLLCLVLAALACRTVLGGASTSTPPPTQSPPPRPTVTERPDPTATELPGPTPTLAPLATDTPDDTSQVLLNDDFTSRQWGTGTDADSAIEYADDALQFIVFTPNWFTWSTPDEETYADVHLEVTTLNNDTDSTTALGLMCNKQPGESSFYYFAITPAGEYAIARATDGEQDLFLTNDDAWAASDLIASNAAAYRLGADCGHGTLTLYVDGEQVDSVSDSTYTSGGVALFVWSGEEATNTDVVFDDFLMTTLP